MGIKIVEFNRPHRGGKFHQSSHYKILPDTIGIGRMAWTVLDFFPGIIDA
jgi:hypothetical protein